MSTPLDHSSHGEFVAYCAEKCIRPSHIQHFGEVRTTILRILS